MKIISFYIKPLLNHPLNRNNKINTIFRVIKWQIRLKIVMPFELIVPFIGNSKFIVKKGRTGLTGNLYSGLHEFYDMIFLLHFLRPEDIFFDVGANVGSYSILSSGFVGATTFSFEPVPDTFALLEANRLINLNSDKWHTKQLALGSENSRLLFSADNDTMNCVVDSDYKGKKIVVDVATLDSFCSENNVAPQIIKIDAEGFDEQVILGGNKLLLNENLFSIIIEGNSEIVQSELMKAGFKPYSYNPFLRTLELGGSHETNQLYIKNIDQVFPRLKSALPINVLNFSI